MKRIALMAVSIALAMLTAMSASAGDNYDYPTTTTLYEETVIEQVIQIEGKCIPDQTGQSRAIYNAEGRPGAVFTVNGVNIGGALAGGKGIFGENTWSVAALDGYEIVGPTEGSFVIEDCTPPPVCEQPSGCDETTTTTTVEATTSTTQAAATSTTDPACDPLAQPSCEPPVVVEDGQPSQPVLPFTGIRTENLLMAGSGLVILGALALWSVRKREDAA